MKLLLSDYLASLKEREELDAVLPDLLSELGFTILSRPQRGTQQRGVDIAAVGADEDGVKKLFLFSVKAGDMTRQDWDGTPQALRSSLNEIRDVYIKTRIQPRYAALKIVVCLAFGGGVKEQVQDQLKGYIEDNSTDRVSFDVWNGDKIAGLLLSGVLREKFLPPALRTSFRKAVALVDEPDVSYQHFSRLARLLREQGEQSAKARVRATRQLNLCTWVLFVWARDTGNVEAAYRASEVAMLSVWHLLRPLIGKSSRDAKDLTYSIRQMIDLHLTIASDLLERTVFPHTGVLHGVSMAVGSREASDVNLALFDILGRIGMAALWIKWVGDMQGATDLAGQGIAKFVAHGLALIETNPALLLPATDRQATDVALFLFAWSQSGAPGTLAQDWLHQMAKRFDFTIRTRGRYPIVSVDYRDIVAHPHDRSDAYFEETTSGSTLLPLIASWLHAFGDDKAVEALAKLQRDQLDHSTWQLWLPDEDTEQRLYSGEDPGGRSLNDLSLQEGGGQLLEIIATACKEGEGLRVLTACATGYWPIVLVACRHHHLPVPPGFWIDVLIPEVAPT